MKLKRCFIDENGSIWKDSSLIEKSKELQPEPFDISQISYEEVLRWKIVNIRDYVSHFKRVLNADCSIPIILRSDGYPMDGLHRIIKALSTGEKLTAKKFKITPEPDFKIKDITEMFHRHLDGLHELGNLDEIGIEIRKG